MSRCLSLLGMLMCVGCVHSDAVRSETETQRSTLIVAAASNLQFAFEEMEREFESEYPKIDLRLTYGSSASFHAQISQQAPFDMFFSADTFYPESLVGMGFTNPADYFIYADGTLALFTRSKTDFDFESVGWNGLLNPEVRKISIANPKLAPYGQAAEQTLRELGVYENVIDKLVFGENVTQAAQFVATGAADVGLIAGSLASAMSEHGISWPVPQSLYNPITQAAIICANCRDRTAANQLKQFILGPMGIKILASNGYVVTIPAPSGKKK